MQQGRGALKFHETELDGQEKPHDDTEENSCLTELVTSLKVSLLYNNNQQQFSDTKTSFPFGCSNPIVELCDSHSFRLICQLFQKD